MNTRCTGRTTVRGPLRTAISTAIGTTVMNTRCTGRTTVRGPLRTAISTAIGTTVMNTRCTGRTTVRGPLRTAISTAIGTTVMNTRCTGRTTVRKPLLLVRILFRVSHDSSCESNSRDRAPRRAPDRLAADAAWAPPTITVSLRDESLDSDRVAEGHSAGGRIACGSSAY